MPQNTINIDPLSARSLLLELAVNGHDLSTATGFIVQQNGTDYLVTNWHVLSGRNPETGQPMSPTAAIPDELRIVHHQRDRLGYWLVKSESLINPDGSNRWQEHPNGRDIDIAALPLSPTSNDIDIYPFDLNLADVDMIPEPAMPISIIGFPFGLSAGGVWPIWKTGHIATDPDINYDGRPAFLIDATTRGGMSGSPVALRMSGGFRTRSGNRILASGVTTKFLGIYSGRIHGEAEIGMVWRPDLINEVIANEKPEEGDPPKKSKSAASSKKSESAGLLIESESAATSNKDESPVVSWHDGNPYCSHCITHKDKAVILHVTKDKGVYNCKYCARLVRIVKN